MNSDFLSRKDENATPKGRITLRVMRPFGVAGATIYMALAHLHVVAPLHALQFIQQERKVTSAAVPFLGRRRGAPRPETPCKKLRFLQGVSGQRPYLFLFHT